MPAGLTLTEITIDDSQLRKVLGPATSKKIVSKYVKHLNKLAILSKEAYQSKIPIDTHELRDTFVMILKKATSADPTVLIGIRNGTHYGKDRKPMNSIALADVLNLGKIGNRTLLRTKTSDSVSPYSSISRRSPTQGWIRSARSAFASARRTYLSANRF